MPIYEYRCNECQHKLETLQKLSDPLLVTCPKCGKDALTKLVSAAGFQLKGSGWYATDFKGGGSSTKKADSADAPAAKSTAGESKGEGKSETKTESAPKAETSSTPTPPASSTSSSSES